VIAYFILTTTNLVLFEQKFVDANLSTIQQFQKDSFDVLAAIVTPTLAGVVLNFDQSGTKFALPDDERKIRPSKNIVVARPAGVPPLPVHRLSRILAGPLSAVDINIANIQLNYNTAAANRETTVNLFCTK